MNQKEEKYLALIESNRGLIYKVASVYTQNREDRKDLIQEIYFQIWKSLESFKEASKVSTWLYRVSMNTSIQYLKKKNRTVQQVELKELNLPAVDENLSQQEEAIQKLLRSIQVLNELDKGIILLYLEDKTHKEIAEIIGITVSNVGTRIQRIKAKLKKLNQ